MNDKHQVQLGEPSIEIAGLQIWVRGRQFPDLHDYWDGNWLRVTVRCGAKGASVWTGGSIIHLSELYDWLISIRNMNESLTGEANLECIEPELSVSLKAEKHGHIAMEVHITPDHLEQDHLFRFEIDQSYLPKLLSCCQKVLSEYPIRGKNEKS